MIYTFGDIPGLAYYINAGEEGTVTNGANDTVTSISSTVLTNDDDPQEVTTTWTELEAGGGAGVFHNPASYKLDQWPAFYIDKDIVENTGFEDASRILSGYAGPLSIVTVSAAEDDSTTRALYNSFNTNNNDDYMKVEYYLNQRLRHRVSGGTQPSSYYVSLGVPNIIVQTWDAEVGVEKPAWLYRNKLAVTTEYLREPGLHVFRNFALFPSFNGPFTLFAVYTKVLSQQEIDDVTDLCTYWLENGEAPTPVVPEYPTSERFGPVRANDTGADYQWQLQAPGDTDNWQDVPVDGYDITASTEGDDHYLDVNSATLDQNGTLVRCKATTTYNTDGIYTNVNTLNVVG